MEFLTGFPLMVQQTKTLVRKNIILTMRNKRVALIQIAIPFIFMAMLYGMRKSSNFLSSLPALGNADPDPKRRTDLAIPPCEDKLLIRVPCYDFAWSGSGNPVIEGIVKRIMEANPGRIIPSDKVKSFRTREELNEWLMQNPLTTPGALYFNQTDQLKLSFGVQTNTSSYVKIGQIVEDEAFMHQLPLQLAATREIARSLLKDPNFGWDVSVSDYAHPEVEQDRAVNFGKSFDIFFIVGCVGFGIMFQLGAVVQDKELKLRQAMTMMGLYDSAYWMSWLIWESIMSLCSTMFLIIFGCIFRIDFFIKNDVSIIFLLFFLFQLTMLPLIFFISSFFQTVASTTTVGYIIYVACAIISMNSSYFYTEDRAQKSVIMYSLLLPPLPLGGGISLLKGAIEKGGIRWSDVFKATKCQTNSGGLSLGIASCISMINYMKWLPASFFAYFILALYFDNILPNSCGVGKPLHYFLKPSYWTGVEDEVKNLDKEAAGSSTQGEDDSVVEEKYQVRRQVDQGNVDQDVAVQLRGLAKTYTSFKIIPPKISKFKALKGMWINFAKDQLFCMLGSNGAGKTTAIGCLTGILPVTRGDAIVFGNSVRSPANMAKIRRMTGVCSQFDTLWSKLTGLEHLVLFACIKGLLPLSSASEGLKLLGQVKLSNAANVKACNYSGGMKRRLSVAIALIGDPKFLVFDEPTTGMDPVARRHVWDIIVGAKQGRCIILTTHAMEEADILSDRLGIMAKGTLRCVGTSLLLKQKFGAGFIIKVNFIGDHTPQTDHNTKLKHERVKDFFRQRLNVEAIAEHKNLTFAIDGDNEHLEEFFVELETREGEFEISNFQIGLTTLEQVFLNVAETAEKEADDQH